MISRSESPCAGCTAACCQDVLIAANQEDAVWLKERGTNLLRIPLKSEPGYRGRLAKVQAAIALVANPDRRLLYPYAVKELSLRESPDLASEGVRDYLMVGKCGNLAPDNTCGAYEERPDVCRTFAVGSAACVNLRAMSRERF